MTLLKKELEKVLEKQEARFHKTLGEALEKQDERFAGLLMKHFFTKDETLKRFATKEDVNEVKNEILKICATKDDLERFATKDDLERFATKDDLERFATKEDVKRAVDDGIDRVKVLFERNNERIQLIAEGHGNLQIRIEDHEKRISKLE